MKIVLHIGTEKTGTTSIQGFLSSHRDDLRKHNILYSKILGDPNNIRLSIALQNIDKIDDSRIYAKLITKEQILAYREELKENLQKEITSENPEVLIISSEHLSSRMNQEEELERLKVFLNEFSDDITVLIYLRRQDEFFESLYSTAIKKGHITEFSFPEKGKGRKDFHYNAMLKLWENTFGYENMRLNVFEKEKLYQQDVVSDFIYKLNLPIKFEKIAKKRENLSFGRKKLSFLKEFNAYVPEIIEKRSNPYRGNIEKLLESIEIEDETIQMSSHEKIEYVKRFLEENKEVAKRYNDSEDLFVPVSLEKKEKVDILISSSEAIEIVAKVWSKKQQECNDKDFMIQILKIDLQLAKDNVVEALTLAKSFQLKNPAHPRSNFYYAKALFRNNYRLEAIEYCQKAINLNPQNEAFTNYMKILKKGIE